MIDCFATLDVNRHPWLEEEPLKQTFFRLSAVHHPDQPTGDAARFEAINAAWNTLKDPVTCLKHWLDLESPGFTAPSTPPPELIDLFMEAGALQQSVTAFDQEYAAATSALSRSLLEPRRLVLITKKDALLARLQVMDDEHLATIRGENPTIASLQQCYAYLAYLRKWKRSLGNQKVG